LWGWRGGSLFRPHSSSRLNDKTDTASGKDAEPAVKIWRKCHLRTSGGIPCPLWHWHSIEFQDPRKSRPAPAAPGLIRSCGQTKPRGYDLRGMPAWRELYCVSVAVRRRGRKVRPVLVDDRSLRGEVGRVASGGGRGDVSVGSMALGPT